MNRLRHSTVVRRVVGVALLTLVLGQWAVLVHAIEHARASVGVAGKAGTDHAWGHQAGTAACHLVDHLLTGQAPGKEPAATPHLPPAASRPVAPGPSIGSGRVARTYEARGPPAA